MGRPNGLEPSCHTLASVRRSVTPGNPALWRARASGAPRDPYVFGLRASIRPGPVQWYLTVPDSLATMGTCDTP